MLIIVCNVNQITLFNMPRVNYPHLYCIMVKFDI